MGHGQVIEMCSHAIFYISVVLKGSQVSPKITCSYIYIYIYICVCVCVYIYVCVCVCVCVCVVGCYAAWNNNYSGQEEATLCIVKYLKEDRKLVFQIRNKIFNNNVIG